MSNVSCIGVVGAGAMGSGITQSALAAGLKVILFDRQRDAVQRASDAVLNRLKSDAGKGRLAPHVAGSADSRLTRASSLSELRDAQLVVEAIVEQLTAKQEVFAALETITAPGCVLASNTSSLSIAAIARNCERPDRICGMHFFNPVPLMRLVEIIRGPSTSDETLGIARDLARHLDKVAIDAVDAPGFLVNLGGRAYVTEALHLVQEGAASIPAIDAIMREAGGFRMGPFELMDLTGIDVNLPVTKQIFEGYQGEPRLQTTYLHQLMVDAGKYGRKAGQGFYDYSGGAMPARANRAEATDSTSPVSFATGDRLGSTLSEALRSRGLAVSDRTVDPILIEPFGEDVATVCSREGMDARRVVGIDATGLSRNVLTIMAPIGADETLELTRSWLAAVGYTVYVIADTPGFVAQRILAMIANLGCEIAQMRLGTPADIDRAMELGLNYPAGPLAIADLMGLPTVHRTLANLQTVTGSDRYRPSLWLRQRSMLGLSAKTPAAPRPLCTVFSKA